MTAEECVSHFRTVSAADWDGRRQRQQRPSLCSRRSGQTAGGWFPRRHQVSWLCHVTTMLHSNVN